MTAKRTKKTVRAMLIRWEKEAHRLRELGFGYDGDTNDSLSETLRNLDTAVAHAYGVLAMADKPLEERLQIPF